MKSLAQFCLTTLFFPSLISIAHAGDASSQWAKDCVKHRLIEPLRSQERHRSPFSRAAPPPEERRVNALATEFAKDRNGREFIPINVEARYGSEWHTAFTGCVIRGSGDVLIEIGDEHRPAAFLLGKEVPAVEGACRTVAPEPGA